MHGIYLVAIILLLGTISFTLINPVISGFSVSENKDETFVEKIFIYNSIIKETLSSKNWNGYYSYSFCCRGYC